jgi:MinD-like ATPase involved in chromosome partitioning or flagellar assembly
MLLALWSPKGGAGTSVLAATCALLLAREGDARLADLGGDQPALLGLARDPETGLLDWLAAGPEAPADALERIAVDAAPGLAILPAGRVGASPATPEAGAALGVLLRDDPRATVADLGACDDPATHALAAVADASVVVVRGCYLALRRAVRAPAAAGASGVAVVAEPGRSLGPREIADVLGLPVLATVDVRPPVARTVDAGVLTTRLPESLARPARALLDRLDLPGRAGWAA